MPVFTIAVVRSMLLSQRDYCHNRLGRLGCSCSWFNAQQFELLAEMDQAYQQLTAELE